MKRQNVKPLIFNTYIAVIKNSVGAKIWRNFYAEVNRKPQDIMRNGDLSCAFFVSSVLALFGLTRNPHATVSGTLEDMGRSGWRKIKKPKTGSVLVWEAIKDSRGEMHKHIGFYIGDGMAISNSSKARMPIKHHWTFGERNGKPVRQVETIFWHPKLD